MLNNNTLDLTVEQKALFDVLELTNRSVFLTGKAGTGKTTFLKHYLAHSRKNIVVAAPTGVAAINAGGVTLHSLFHLPFKAYAPVEYTVAPEVLTNTSELFSGQRFNQERKDLLQSLDTLVIDEVSMVRADMLDAIDATLRRVRKNTRPFGGVQLFLIGDLYQLPPVIRNHEWRLLSQWYASYFFFDSLALKNNAPIVIEFSKIYRQSEKKFIDLLNTIRENTLDASSKSILEDRIQAPEGNENIITLTTHNEDADLINRTELSKLTGKSHFFEAVIEGDFKENSYPIEEKLEFKVHAQVMFIKNDRSGEQAYYNGKIARITEFTEDGIIVETPEQNQITVNYETWNNINYQLNEQGEVKEEIIGTFKQIPLRLAWAITIHKSQGLTFDRVIIDAAKAFAHGQVYVALSRCRSLEGLFLTSSIESSSLTTDRRIQEVHQQVTTTENLEKITSQEKYSYAVQQLAEILNFKEDAMTLGTWQKFFKNKKSTAEKSGMELLQQFRNKFNELDKIAQKFNNISLAMVQSIHTEKWNTITDKSIKAMEYFVLQYVSKIMVPLVKHMNEYKKKSRSKGYVNVLDDILYEYQGHLSKMRSAKLLDVRLFSLEDSESNIVPQRETPSSTYDITLEMIEKGHTLPEIAQLRELQESTLHGHVLKLYQQGKIQSIEPFISKERIEKIQKAIEKKGIETKVTVIKNLLPEDFTFFEIRLVMAKWKLENA